MGVPKFYRWISERYPCLSEVIQQYQIPDFDNLYLDMNGIIHTCSHPNDDDPHFRISEEKIFAGICHYIDFLFKMIKPKKVFFMAVDGVAPRAKMNQQRGRRFRTAKTATILEEQAKALGEALPTEARFDSNCITPGTEFMARLHNILKEFVIYKVSSDKLWRNVRVYLSGHETPGEGEHKIMDFIRYEKSQPGYNPNVRHCLYGLDADLIMLGLCSHEPYFSLLREEVKFGSKKNQKRIMTPEETTFHLLHISLLRDYLSHEFSPIKDKISFEFSVESIVDDFVLMSFLVGNDFIPHLPQLHIHHDALPVLFRTYMDVLPSLDGYINEQGNLNLSRFEAFLKKLSEYDFKKFGELNDDLTYLNDKKTKDKNCNSSEIKENTSDILSGLGFSSLAISKMAEFDSSSDEDNEEEDDDDDKSDSADSLELELFNMHKTDYYMNKLEFSEVTEEVLKDQAEGYVRAIQWNLHYYYNGVVSWSWYYPHHYSPYISDVKDFKNMEMKFDLGEPFLPFQQLLSVLPKLSKDLLPKSYQKLMCNEDSPLIDYYPDDFQTDLNGKQQEWEAIVLIPFINEKLLLKFAAAADQELTEEESKRNSHGPHLLYMHDPNPSGSRPSFLPDYYPALSNTYFKAETIPPDFFRLPADRIYKGLPKGVILDKIVLGFPTLRSLEHTAQLRNEKVKVFQMMSMKDNMMLTIINNRENNLRKVAEEIVGKIIYVGWPHLREAFVVAVSDGKEQILFDKSKSSSTNVALMDKEMTADEQDIWKKQTEGVEERNYQRWGIIVGDINILVHVKCLSGLKMIWTKEVGLIEEKQWDGILCNFAFQTTLFNIDILSPSAENPIDPFSPSSVVFILTPPYYGSMGTVLNFESDKPDQSILLDIEIVVEPDLSSVIQNQDSMISDQYMPGYVVAQYLGVESYFVSHLTGTILIQTSPKGSSSPNRVNVGLNLKFNRKNEEVQGYTKKIENAWYYSNKAVKLLNSYLSTFPDFFEKLFKFVRNDVIYLEDLYPNGEGQELIKNIEKWIKSQESYTAERQKCGTKRLDPAIIREIERIQSQNKDSVYHIKKSFLPQHLFSPYMCKGITKPDNSARFYLFDRVININAACSVPLGLRGTIIGMSAEENESDVMYEIVFDKEFFGGLTLSCSPEKGYRLPAHHLINLTHGLKIGQKQLNLSPAKNANKYFNKSAASDAIMKHLQSDNMISAAQLLQRKPQTSPNKPFYNVNEMFQAQSQDFSPQNRTFSSNLPEVSNKQFVTPKAGYVASNFHGKPLVKKNTPSPSQTNYQDFWTDLKKSTPESTKVTGEPMYGQKVSVKELFQSVENQNEPKYNQRNQNEQKYNQNNKNEPNYNQSNKNEPKYNQSNKNEPKYNQSNKNEPKYNQSNNQKPSFQTQPFVDMLLKLCLKYFSAPPIYTYHNYGNTRLCIASITLPNGTKVTGAPCEQKLDAATSAAEKAVATLSALPQSAANRNDLHNVIQSNLVHKDQGLFNRGGPPPRMFPSPLHGQILMKNAPFPQQPPMYPPPPFDFHHDRPLQRHPTPVQSHRIPDSFVASNQFLINNTPPTPLSAPVPRYPPPPSDPDLFYMPGGGTARIKNQPMKLTSVDPSSLFVPNQVMKLAMKTPFDSSGASNEDWPDLPAKSNSTQSYTSNKIVTTKAIRTTNPLDIVKSKESPSVAKTANPSSNMTVLTKKPPRRRIAAKFENP